MLVDIDFLILILILIDLFLPAPDMQGGLRRRKPEQTTCICAGSSRRGNSASAELTEPRSLSIPAALCLARQAKRCCRGRRQAAACLHQFLTAARPPRSLERSLRAATMTPAGR